MTKLRNSVGERIRAIRKAKGLTQQQLAELSGLDDAYIGSLERGERNFSIDTLEKILLGLEIHPLEIFHTNPSLNEAEKTRLLALDEFTITTSELNIDQINAVRRILKEIRSIL